jgi:hypothetical protein
MQAHAALAALEAGRTAHKLGRIARAVELYERALAAADADPALPRDSLLVATVLQVLVVARVKSATHALMPEGAALTDNPALFAAHTAAWRTEPRALALSQRLLALMLARCDAGALFAPLTPIERRASGTEEEHTQQLRETPGGLPLQRAQCLFLAAADAVVGWPQLSNPVAEAARVCGVAAALRAALTLYQHGYVEEGRRVRGLTLTAKTATVVGRLLCKVLGRDATSSAGLLRALRATCGLTNKEEATLRQEVLPIA